VDHDPNIHYHMGIDGISLWLVVLTTFLTPLCVLISWKSVHDRVKEFFILLLIHGDGADRRLHLARPVPLLLLLGSRR
jgi:NADH:ubiquinone oxidoreductase subunit 4 (subunit M)